MTAPARPSGSLGDTLVAIVLLVLLVPIAGMAVVMAAYFELSNKTCGASYGGCYTPYVNLGFMVAAGGAGAALLGSTIWIAVGAAKGWSVGYVPLVGVLLIIATFFLGGEIATWA
ncbi:hypothetical protein ACIBEH_16915 [Nocardia salmonicida]|uniref:hypothetical protein n=1 Tax=Nocardia TaxID=1817 RepID=UPI002658427F|nr:hypothetical protein [Nocardia sp. PE-7]WKG09486.1 hypothetical protein QX204_31515 [Nocardia sp. PE-7]